MQTQTFIQPVTSNNQLLFMPAIFNDTLKLLLEAQDYFTHYGPDDQSKLSMPHRLLFTSEMSRITLRLSSIMAWLLAKRASHTGHAPEGSKLNEYTLQFQDVCLQDTLEATYALPTYMRGLLERTLALYARACRLDAPAAIN